jgi:hypothetical protein
MARRHLPNKVATDKTMKGKSRQIYSRCVIARSATRAAGVYFDLLKIYGTYVSFSIL